MYVSEFLTLSLSTLLLLDKVAGAPQGNGKNGNNNNNGGQQNTGLTLDSNNVQSASDSNGNPDTNIGEAASETDPANFINVCSGQQLANGAQITGGACEGTTMGKLPAKSNMVSTIILSPQPGEDLQPNTAFNVQLQVANLKAGVFTNPDNTYYSAPQDLAGGNIIGHVHVTIQDMGGQLGQLNPKQPLDASTFAFFKGINDDGNGNGLLQAAVANGLPAGNYRVCTMSSAANHQPVLMPVAQRGAQDDCTKFTIGAGTGNNNNNNANVNDTGNGNANTGNGNTNTGNANAGKNNNGNQNANKGNQQTSTTSAAAAATDTATNKNKGNANSNNRNGNGNQNAGNNNQQTSSSTSAANAAKTDSANTNTKANQQASNTTTAANATKTGDSNANNKEDNRHNSQHDHGKGKNRSMRQKHRFAA